MIRLGTRASLLATTQSTTVMNMLKEAGHECELKTFKTPGDVHLGPVEKIGVGVFTQALRDALANKECEVAVHSFKDLPTAPDPRFVLITPKREDPREALVARDGMKLEDLPEGAKVGTSAPRRVGQLRLIRPDLEICPLRGNVDTRISKVTSGELDAVILAAAGLKRIGRLDEATEIFDPTVFMPAPAQGALAVEAVPEAAAAILPLMDEECTYRVQAERAVLATLEAGCTAPVAAYSVIAFSPSGERLLIIQAGVFGTEKSLVRTVSGPVEKSIELGQELGNLLLKEGAKELFCES